MLIWLAVGLVVALVKRPIREAIVSLVRAFFVRQIVIAVSLLLGYILALVVFLYHLALWTPSLLTTTVFWSISGAFVALMNINSIDVQDDHYFRNLAKEQFQLLAIFEFVFTMYVFSLWLELVLVPVLALIGGMIAVVEADPKHGGVKKFLDSFLLLLGLAVAIFSVYKVSTDFEGFASSDTLRDFAVPAVMSIAFIPFIYVAALYVRYENLFLRLSFFVRDVELLRFTMWKTVLTIRFSLRDLIQWTDEVVRLRFESKGDVRKALADFKARKQNS